VNRAYKRKRCGSSGEVYRRSDWVGPNIKVKGIPDENGQDTADKDINLWREAHTHDKRHHPMEKGLCIAIIDTDGARDTRETIHQGAITDMAGRARNSRRQEVAEERG
jgi:hypothetical protein